MSKFHSTVNRRDFMKALGLAGAGLGAAAAAAPVFRDLDEVANSTSSNIHTPYYPWWVKERDFFDPTVEIDWDPSWRVDGRKSRLYQDPTSEWYFNAYTAENIKKYVDAQNEYDPDFDWSDPRRQAIDAGCGFLRFGSFRESTGKRVNIHSWLGYRDCPTPEQKGYPKWTGTPEENLRLLRGAVRYFGGDDVGVMEHDSHLDRIVPTYDVDGYKNSFEDIDEPYETKDPRVHGIPNSFKWAFVWTLRQAMDMTRRGAGASFMPGGENPLGVTESAGVWRAYSELAIVENRLQEFIRALGYWGLAGGMSAMMPGTALATLSGRLEHARMGQVAIHPKWGATVRGTYKMFTNLPLAPTKPIDAGIYNFCKTCGICAEHCPTGIIQSGPASWTTGRDPANPEEGPMLPYQAQGFLGWRTDIGKCPHCPVCQTVCPFSVMWQGSFMHDVVKVTVANTTLFNSFFYNMDKAFDYGRKPQVDYWDIWDEHPVYGMDTMR